jgi:hypothetical protein
MMDRILLIGVAVSNVSSIINNQSQIINPVEVLRCEMF